MSRCPQQTEDHRPGHRHSGPAGQLPSTLGKVSLAGGSPPLTLSSQHRAHSPSGVVSLSQSQASTMRVNERCGQRVICQVPAGPFPCWGSGAGCRPQTREALGCSGPAESCPTALGSPPIPCAIPVPQMSRLKGRRVSLAASLRKLCLLVPGPPVQPPLCKLPKSARGEGRDASICGQSTPTEDTSLHLAEVRPEFANVWSCNINKATRGQYSGHPSVPLTRHIEVLTQRPQHTQPAESM